MFEISKLNKKQQIEYFNCLKGLTIKYRSLLGIDKSITFGVEIEYENIVKDTVSYYLNQWNDETKNSKKWINKTEIDIARYNIYGEEVNGEINSPILTDNIYSWLHLKQVLDLLKSKDGYVSNVCGGHIHIGTDVLENNVVYLKNLLLLWTAYEKEIINFSKGEFRDIRPYQKINAGSISQYLKSSIDIINNCDSDEFKDYIKNIRNFIYSKLNINILEKRYTINFSNIKKARIKKDNTIEFRIPNGTLKEEIWQNNINFFVKLLIASKKHLDYDKILFDINNDKDKTLQLADLIFEDEIDKSYFLIQSLKLNKNYNKDFTYYKRKY